MPVDATYRALPAQLAALVAGERDAPANTANLAGAHGLNILVAQLPQASDPGELLKCPRPASGLLAGSPRRRR